MDAPDLISALSKIFAEVKEKYPSIITKVLKRPNLGNDGKETWMETYILDENLEQSLRDLIEVLMIKYNLNFSRNYEVFHEHQK